MRFVNVLFNTAPLACLSIVHNCFHTKMATVLHTGNNLTFSFRESKGNKKRTLHVLY